nr:putative reverse transcriptase domain, ribonuclease H-like domain, aspartic peptidase domain protein [Tanacetum cinerariifolium]
MQTPKKKVVTPKRKVVEHVVDDVDIPLMNLVESPKLKRKLLSRNNPSPIAKRKLMGKVTSPTSYVFNKGRSVLNEGNTVKKYVQKGKSTMVEDANTVKKAVDKCKGKMVELERPVRIPSLYSNNDSDSGYSDKSVDCLSEGEDELIELRKRKTEVKNAPKVRKQQTQAANEGMPTGQGLTLMFDQQKGLIEAVKEVMPHAEHHQCSRHIYERFRKQYNGVEFRLLFWAASKATYPGLFNKIIEKIKRYNPNSYDYLLKKEPKTWSRAYFHIGTNCETVENGFSECFNSVILSVGIKPLITILEAIRVIILERMHIIRKSCDKWTADIFPNIHKRLELIKDQHRFWHVIPTGGNLFEVRNGSEAFGVDEERRNYTCRLWQLSVPSTYEVGGPSTATPVGHLLTTMASGVATQNHVIDDLCVRMSNLEYRHRELVKKMEIVSDAEAADSIAIREIHPRVTTLEGQTPESSTEIRSFLGLAGYYQRFIENFSNIAKPLTLLPQKNKTYVWGDKQDEAFHILKEKLCNAFVLTLPNGPNDYVVYCDASKQGFGRWIELLSDYECEIKYNPGKAVVADALSRKERLEPRRVRAMSITIHSGLKTKILEAQGKASKDLKAPAEWLRGLETHFERRDDGGIYIFDHIWIPSVGGRDIAEYVSRCLTCSKVKAEHQKPSGLLQQPEIPEWKWGKKTMDLVTNLPRSSSGYDAIWVIMDRLTKSAHFLPIREDYKTNKLARIYINEIIARHGVPVSIISNRDAYHPEIDGQSERTIQTLEDMYRACVMDFGGSWDTCLLLVEFSYNNSYHTSIKCAPFEALYERKCRSPVIWTEVGESQLIGPEIVQEKIIQIKESKKGKLAPRYVRPFKIVEYLRPVAYWLKLPQELSCVHDTFHVSNLKKCFAEPDVQVPLDEIEIDENLHFVEERIEIVERDVKKVKSLSDITVTYFLLSLDYHNSSVMDIPLLLDHAFDFFVVEPFPGLAEAPDNQNGWIEWDVPLGGKMDKPIENPGFDEEEELNEFMDDDQDEEVEEWLMALVTPPRATVTVPSTYDVGGPSTDTPVGHPLTTMASGVATQPQVIDDLCVRMSNLEYRHGEPVKKMEIVSDAEVADSIAIREIHPRVTTLEGQVQTLQTSLHGAWLQNQQLQTRLSEMENHKGTLISFMYWMEDRLVVLEKRLMGPPTVPQFIENFSNIAKPLTLLTQKNKTYVWGDKQDEAFRILKEKLWNAPVLALPDGPNNYVVYCDASKQCFGCVLMQRGKKELNMRQRRWIELLSDYECEIKYYPGKANVVVDALSRKEILEPRRVHAMSITIHSGLKTKILEAQGEASKDLKAPTEWLRGLETHFERRDDDGIYFFDHIWIPSVGGVRKLIKDEAHTSRYSIHPGADKMYYDLRDLYWCPGMKKDIADYVSRCLTCSKVKAEHQNPSGLLQQPEIPKWKWEKITMDLVTNFPRSSSGYDGIEVIVDRLTKSAHFLPIREDYKTEKLARIYINKIVARHGVSVSIISERKSAYWARNCARNDKNDNSNKGKVETVRSRQKSYADKRRKPLEFKVGDRVLLKVSPWKGVVRFDEIEIDENLHFVEERIEIVDRDVKKLKRRRIPLVKVRWNSRQGAEYTWEREDQFRKKYSHLFTEPVPSSSVAT